MIATPDQQNRPYRDLAAYFDYKFTGRRNPSCWKSPDWIIQGKNMNKNLDFGRDFRNGYCFLALALTLSGCAYSPDNYVYSEQIDTARLSTIKKIALLDVPVPSGIWLGSPGSGETAGIFGPLVALATASHEGDRIVNPAAISAKIHDDTKEWLQSTGIVVSTVRAQRPNPSKMLRNYDQFRSLEVDAILEIGTSAIGFRPEIGKFQLSEDELSPDVVLVYRLVAAKSGVTIVESSALYSSFFYSQDLAGGVILGPRQHLLRGVEAVEANRGTAVQNLEYAIKGATEYVAMTIANNNRGLRYSGAGVAQLQSNDQASSTTASLSSQQIDHGNPDSAKTLWNLLAGNTWSGKTRKGTKFSIYFAPDGKVFGKSRTRRNMVSIDSGDWNVNHVGEYCRRWQEWFDRVRECFNVTHIGGDKYMVNAIGDSKGTEVVIAKGDTQGLRK